jgi:hypothetical protein
MNMDINEKEIEKASRKIDLSGFQMQDELNSRIWDKEQKMKSEVKKTLLKIADDYFESLELPGVDIEDVTMTGSLANYNWSKYSDIDLHIVVDYNDLPMDKDLVQDFFKSKSSNWNKEHDVKIYGYDVELYVQDINEPHHSTGVYSILNNEWNIKPEKRKIDFNDKSVKEKAERLMDRIEEIYDEMGDVGNEETIERVDKLTEKIKKMRKSGLESGGEFSVENIVFKVLRRNGMLDRLYDIKTVSYDKSVTLESIQEVKELDQLLESMGDDFDWVRDIEPRLPQNHVPKIGSKMVCLPGFQAEWDSYKYTIASLDPNYGGAGYEEGRVIVVDSIGGWGHSTRTVVWPTDDYSGIYVDALQYLEGIPDDDTPNQPIMTESESDDFDWIRDVSEKTLIDKQPHKSSEYNITNRFFNREDWSYKGWKIDWDNFIGIAQWRNEDIPDMLYLATPYWDGVDYVPVNYDYNYGDDFDSVGNIDIPEFEYEEDLIDWLENNYFEEVYKLISRHEMEYLGPLAESI